MPSWVSASFFGGGVGRTIENTLARTRLVLARTRIILARIYPILASTLTVSARTRSSSP